MLDISEWGMLACPQNVAYTTCDLRRAAEGLPGVINTVC